MNELACDRRVPESMAETIMCRPSTKHCMPLSSSRPTTYEVTAATSHFSLSLSRYRGIGSDLRPSIFRCLAIQPHARKSRISARVYKIWSSLESHKGNIIGCEVCCVHTISSPTEALQLHQSLSVPTEKHYVHIYIPSEIYLHT